MNHIFISYVRENHAEVERLAKALTNFGLSIWLDRTRLKPGDFWKDAIRTAIRSGDYFLACFSKEYGEKQKSYMNEELTLAVEEIRLRPSKTAWFIPVVFSGAVPEWDIGGGRSLRDINWVDFHSGDWDFGIYNIVEAIDAELLIDSGKIAEEYLYESPADFAYAYAEYENITDDTAFGRRVLIEAENERKRILQRLKGIWPNLKNWERNFLARLSNQRSIYRPANVHPQFFCLSAVVEELEEGVPAFGKMSNISWLCRECFDQDGDGEIRLNSIAREPLATFLNSDSSGISR
ncbi:MAG: toll/interleukin-1 receptor domain-containing protein [Verrucomicrobia bacterium]|nr:toll/interleukin-1 receptor domain-containing protein [Verrucomicrobiota bacterium]